jgi:hypothetical protein
MGNWKNIRLELARTEGFPAGSVSRGYLIRLPLSENGEVDRAAFGRNPYRATVRRYWSTEPDEAGLILDDGGRWAIGCSGKPRRTLEVVNHFIQQGHEISIVEADGTILPFRVASVR